MTYLSICSGIEAASIAWKSLDLAPVAFAENEKFASAVLRQHYPTVPNLGDITKFKEWGDLGTIRILIGGTPCQSFSVAGLRGGLDDPRGNLMLSYLAIARRYRPQWVVWENVPGVLSSRGGRDFATFIRGLEECGYGFAYRILDAQHFGVPQRRRRLFVVGHLGNWRRAAAVLFERESFARHRSEGATSREGIAPTLESRTDGGGGGWGTDFLVGGGLISSAVTSKWHKGSGGPSGDECQNLIAFGGAQITHPENRNNPQPGDPAPTLAKRSNMMVAFAELADPIATNQGKTWTREGSHNFRMSNVAMQDKRVRRFTPRECERLQGLPDDYTLVPYGRRLAKDGPRYKAIGNSFAVPVVRWIGERILAVDAI